jgi:hypothetical protein
MKKLIFILSLIAVVMACNPSQAQIATLYMPKGDTYLEYVTDVTLTNTTAKYFQIVAPQNWYTAQSYVVHLDSLSGNHTNVACVLAGRVSDQTSTWTTIGTINWAGTTADTTIIYLNATENQYREFKLTFTGTGTGTTTIANMEFKQWYGLP